MRSLTLQPRLVSSCGALPRNTQPEHPLLMPSANHDVKVQPQAARTADVAKASAKHFSPG